MTAKQKKSARRGLLESDARVIYSTDRPGRTAPTPGRGAHVLPARGRGPIVTRRGDDRRVKPRLTIDRILAWADAHHARTGEWPGAKSGRVHDAPEESWAAIQQALRQGSRGLPRNLTIVRVLYKHRGIRNANRPPPLTIDQILAWADAFRARHGAWPQDHSGPIHGAAGETWLACSDALRTGLRGLPVGSSLANLLAQQRGVRNRRRPPPLTIKQLLAWADAHHKQTGCWPNTKSGEIPGSGGETWHLVQSALVSGTRRLPRRTTLARLLNQHRGVRMIKAPPPLKLRQVLRWIDLHKRRTGRWPTAHAGPVHGVAGESWAAVDDAVHRGTRGLTGGRSLAGILERYRGVPNRNRPPPLAVELILQWADAYHRRVGRWPGQTAGAIDGQRGITWSLVDSVLRRGARGLPAGLSLPALLVQRRGMRNPRELPLSISRILQWADEHHRLTGDWPRQQAGQVRGAPGERWANIDAALRVGLRGLPGDSSLAQLLEARRNVRNKNVRPPLSVQQIVTWALRHRRRTGERPNVNSGDVTGVKHERWDWIDGALSKGRRGLPGGSSLKRLLDRAWGASASPRRAPGERRLPPKANSRGRPRSR
ncbi:hypothetical protein RAS1_43860 [Phycisphaerae bacterium RAS1]|nr:hypothetical protein RAS1_43860 [Phycisphaerae bacterium RAS1]